MVIIHLQLQTIRGAFKITKYSNMERLGMGNKHIICAKSKVVLMIFFIFFNVFSFNEENVNFGGEK